VGLLIVIASALSRLFLISLIILTT